MRLLFLSLTTMLAAAPLAIAPVATAHDCEAENPATLCGSCESGNHDHRYSNGNLYCKSDSPPPPPDPEPTHECDIYLKPFCIIIDDLVGSISSDAQVMADYGVLLAEWGATQAGYRVEGALNTVWWACKTVETGPVDCSLLP